MKQNLLQNLRGTRGRVSILHLGPTATPVADWMGRKEKRGLRPRFSVFSEKKINAVKGE